MQHIQKQYETRVKQLELNIMSLRNFQPPMACVTCRVTTSHHRAVHKAGCSCDWQATVIGQMLTTLGNNRHAITKLFLAQRLGKSSGGNSTYFWRYSNFIFVW